ncbi:hypothetical protein [Polyangium mundeleinium]|uniref:HTH HARE-type domain-containing protein n=1 Tax=Polyangium mundeleinium TaxID=2995306 RepID=A0ABT5EV46_9BACT|nr:hypothetical protein [Polyangium mundeleinium]MDC0744777.1 hypothetical protein [Polyangium mundeleinium]
MSKKNPPPAASVSEADLRLVLRDALARLAKPTSAAELRKALPKPYQQPLAEITRHLVELAREPGVFVFQDGKTSRYSLQDARETAARAVLTTLSHGPLPKASLQAGVKRTAPGFEKALPAALDDLLARGAVREHPKVGKHPARYGREPPDATPFLAKALQEMQAVHKKLAPCGVTKAALYAALGHALGVTKAGGEGATDDDAVLAALRELASREPPGALLSVRALRGLGPLSKPRFDSAVLRLSRAGKVVLHHHDFPASLPETERAELVQDERGTHYVGIAPGRSA